MRFFTTVYGLLLIYIIAALLFWGFSLARQSRIIYELDRSALHEHIDSARYPALFQQEASKLERKQDSRTKQYIGEGSTFLIIILIGAAVVFNSFRRRISLSKQQNNFMLAVTHELKSPLAGMKLSLETIQRRTLSEEQRAQLLGRCIQETDRLAELCDNMLIASQMEGKQYKAAREEIDFSALVGRAVETYENRYGERFTMDIVPDCDVVGDVTLLQMAVNNLLENAAKYTPPDTRVLTMLWKDEGKVTLQVADQGAGIPDDEKGKVFKKFYRIGDEGTRRTKGTGLGLYLTSQIVRSHGGKLTLKDNVPHGAVFQICLPLKD